ncbi:unnamed protein product, partial [Ceratitis capitata]
MPLSVGSDAITRLPQQAIRTVIVIALVQVGAAPQMHNDAQQRKEQLSTVSSDKLM